MKHIDELWEQFRASVDNADADGKRMNSADGHSEWNALHDYSSQRGWALDRLVGRETANERQHRATSKAPKSFTLGDAARLHVMSNAAFGAGQTLMPKAIAFLTMRQTAAEAMVIGWLARNRLTSKWIEEVSKLDYSKLMQEEL